MFSENCKNSWSPVEVQQICLKRWFTNFLETFACKVCCLIDAWNAFMYFFVCTVECGRYLDTGKRWFLLCLDLYAYAEDGARYIP